VEYTLDVRSFSFWVNYYQIFLVDGPGLLRVVFAINPPLFSDF